jgi:hypothetical protein
MRVIHACLEKCCLDWVCGGDQDRYRDRVIKRVVPVVAMSCALWVLPPSAGAHDHRPPRAVVRSAGERQPAGPWTSTWSRPSGENECVVTHGDGFPNYRRPAMQWWPGRKIHLRLFKRHKPRWLVIRMFVRLDDTGSVTGRGRRADYRLRRARVNGKRVWIAGFFGRRTRRHLYLAVRVNYRDVEGCGGPQTMSLAYHRRRRDT